ncbi:MAG: hypothetical protein J6C06_08040 [Lachnospiraceae bacterium]|nr:hypothetical protein [Lachnospiraceae bacterium]
MKKILKIIPLILIFVFVFSLNIYAAGTDSSDTPMFAITNYDSYYAEMISLGIAKYKSDTGYDGKVFCYADLVNTDSASLHRLDFYIAPLDSSYFTYTTNSVTFHNDSGISQYYLYASGGVSNYFDAQYKNSITSVVLSNNSSAKNLVIYVSQDLSANLTDKETLYYKSPAPLYPVEEEPEEDNDFFFGAFEDFADFGEESAEHYNNAMNQTLTDNSNSPNDSVFMNILQAMVGSLTTNNSITQQISNQLQHFTEQFFNNFAQYSLGLMTDILNTLNEFTGKFDGLLDIVNQLYNSGIGSNGEFGLDNMFSYWLVPSDEFIDSQYNKLVGALPFIDEIQGISDTLLNLFQTVEPKSPTITIHAGTYGFIVLTDDCVIDFDWFLDWKPYTDIFIAVFVYAGLALHLVRQLPGILGGTSSVVNSASGLDKPQKGGKGS